MAHQWRGVIREYIDRLDISKDNPIITLGEGGTPLVEAPALAKLVGAERVMLKVEGMNPTGSFKDRGMTMAVSKAIGHGAKAVICASTGNTSASAAAYAAAAGIQSVVLIPEGKIALGKLSQAVAHKSQIMQVRGNFDDCLTLARDLAENYPVHLVNSVNPDRIEGQKTASFEIVESLDEELLEAESIDVESYLDHHATKLSRRFDPNSYVVLTEAMNSHDVGRGRTAHATRSASGERAPSSSRSAPWVASSMRSVAADGGRSPRPR